VETASLEHVFYLKSDFTMTMTSKLVTKLT
jgi:hypothetical protein